jgi:uncharacterized protein (TIGR00245 family)
MESSPFYSAKHFIPTVGMLLGNAMTGVALGVDSCLTQLHNNKDRIEAFLAYGATRWETARPIAIEGVRLAMLPTLNGMSVMGLIAIPGMMTGQILAGEAPMNAVRYQQIIMFLISAATALATVISVLVSLLALSAFHVHFRQNAHFPFAVYQGGFTHVL